MATLADLSLTSFPSFPRGTCELPVVALTYSETPALGAQNRQEIGKVFVTTPGSDSARPRRLHSAAENVEGRTLRFPEVSPAPLQSPASMAQHKEASRAGGYDVTIGSEAAEMGMFEQERLKPGSLALGCGTHAAGLCERRAPQRYDR